MAARKNRGTKANPMPDEWRNKIRAGNIIKRLHDCVEGTVDLTAQQIKAAEIILRKIEPDLNKTDVTAEHSGKIEHALQSSDKEIINRYLTSKLGADDGTSKS